VKNKHSKISPDNKSEVRPEVAAGLPGAESKVHRALVKAGIDPDRLSILHLGRPAKSLALKTPPWVRRMAVGYFLWAVLFLLENLGIQLPLYLNAIFSLVVGLMIIQIACQTLVTMTERFAARMR
jgi:hypothetical protein